MHRKKRAVVVELLEARRMLSAGGLDSSFGTGGVVVDHSSNPAVAMVLQPDGKILVAEKQGVIQRFNSDGSLDTSFNGNGSVEVFFDIVGIGLQPDGKIIVGGDYPALSSSNNPPVYSTTPVRWYVERFNNDGSADSTYGSGGVPAGLAGAPVAQVGVRHFAYWFAVESDGSAVIGGLLTNPNVQVPDIFYENNDLDLVKFTPEGIPDTSFGINGEAATHGAHWGDFMQQGPMLIEPNGNIAIVGTQSEPFSGLGAVWTLDPAGNFVSSSNLGGGAFSSVEMTATILSDGSLATAASPTFTSPVVLDIDGNAASFGFSSTLPWNTFSSSPDVPPTITPAIGTVDAMLALPNDQVLIATGAGEGAEESNSIALARINSNGSPDETFGFAGTEALTLNPFGDEWVSQEGISALALTSDGGILAAGNFGGHLMLARFLGGSNVFSNGAAVATLTGASALQGSGNTTITADVSFDGAPIDPSSFDDSEVWVTGPGGYSAFLNFQQTTANSQDLATTAVYELGVATSTLSYGVYTVHLADDMVADPNGNPVAGGILGTFYYAPSASSVSHTASGELITPYAPQYGDVNMTFRVRLDDSAGVDLSSFGDDNFQVNFGSNVDGGPYNAVASTNARFVNAQFFDGNRTVVATYEVPGRDGATWGAFGSSVADIYTVTVNTSPRGLDGSAIFPNYDDPIGNFLELQQPTATFAGFAPRTARGASASILFYVRYSGIGVTSYGTVESQTVAVDPVDGSNSQTWATFVSLNVTRNGSILVGYATPLTRTNGTYKIYMPFPFVEAGYPDRNRGPSDGLDFVPAGLISTFDMGTVSHGPSGTLLTAAATVSPRGYVTLQVEFDSFGGFDPATLDDAELILTGPRGFRSTAQLVRFDRNTGGGSRVATYTFRLPRGVTAGQFLSGKFYVSMLGGGMRDVSGRPVPSGRLGAIQVSGVSNR